MKILFYIYECYEQSDAESIWDVEVSASRIRQHLTSRYGVDYNSNQWVQTQLRRYEDEIGVKLFRRRKDPKVTEQAESDDFLLGLYENMVQFYQKRHLYVTQKIKVTNGVYDHIRAYAGQMKEDRPLKLLLGAGTTVYHLAEILAERSWEDETRYDIYTHNLGSLQTLLNHTVNYDRVTANLMSGTIDPVTYTIVGNNTNVFTSTHFDFIVQGTSCVHNGDLYIESEAERQVKESILQECRGTKVLVLTKHEFKDEPLPDVRSYGKLTDYDFVVLPRAMTHTARKKKYDIRFEHYADLLETEIMNWNYCIYRVKPEALCTTS
jgi:DeoR/GlpR family transcriptional regulator of sugar metabolism